MGARLFVGNLPYSATEEEIRDLFAQKWGVVEVRIVTDRETGRSRGFGFVELENEEAAREASTQMEGYDLGGRRMAIREAHDRAGGPPSGPGGPPRPPRRFDDRGPPPAVESAPRRGPVGFRPDPRGGPSPRSAPPYNGGGGRPGGPPGGGRWEGGPPPRTGGGGEWGGAPPPADPNNEFDDGGKNRRRERRKKKKDRHESDSDW